MNTVETGPLETQKKEIKGAIIKTIVFFDIFSYPLTSFELWRYLGVKCSFALFSEVLSTLDLKGIKRAGAFYFLEGRDEIIHTRNRRYNFSNRKMKRAMKISRLFKYIPWIKMIAIGNIMGTNNLKDGSDIDFFIVCEKNRVWISRFISTAITKLLMLRPRVNDVRDKICLSFYLSEEHLSLENLFIQDGEDPYFVYWLANLLPIYDREGIYQKLLNNNAWLRLALPNWQAIELTPLRRIENSPGIFYREIIDLFFGGLDPLLRNLQLKILPNDLRLTMNKDTRVVINSHILKLHVKDRRKAYLEMYKENLMNVQEGLSRLVN